MWTQTYWYGARTAPDRADWSAVRVLQPAVAGKEKAITSRPLSSIGRPAGALSPKVSPAFTGDLGHDVSGDPIIRIRFDGVTCCACPCAPPLRQAILNRVRWCHAASSRTSTTTRKGYGCVRQMIKGTSAHSSGVSPPS